LLLLLLLLLFSYRYTEMITVLLQDCGFYNLKFLIIVKSISDQPMEHCTLKNVSISLNTNIYSYLETYGGRSYNLYLNVAQFFNTSVNETSAAA